MGLHAGRHTSRPGKYLGPNHQWSQRAMPGMGVESIGRGRFTPNDLRPILWLDAADTQTITSSGGSVSAWQDKSRLGYSFAQAGARKPTTGSTTRNGLNVLSFSAQNVDYSTYAGSNNVTGLTAFTMCRVTGPGNLDSRLVSMSVGTSTGSGRMLCEYTDAATVQTRGRRLDADAISTVNGAETTSAWGVGTHINNYTGGATTAQWNEGTIYSTAVAGWTGNTSATDSMLIKIGTNSLEQNTSDFVGDCGEIIIYPYVLSTAEQTKVRSYLYEKWAL